MKKERTPEEKMEAFLDLVAGDEKKPAEDAAAAPTDAELDRQLAEAGFDLERVNAHVEADRKEALRALEATEAAPKVEPPPAAKVIALPPRRRSTLLWLIPLAAAFAVGIGLGGAAVVAWLDSSDNPTNVASGGNADERARGFRDDAYAACQHERWEECSEKIDTAIQLYPPFAKDEALARLRALAKEKMAGKSAPTGRDDGPIPCSTDADCHPPACGPCTPGEGLTRSAMRQECAADPCRNKSAVCSPAHVCVVGPGTVFAAGFAPDAARRP